jgi:3',5'-cyclic AMP phosphodiesterase CpdA
VTGRPLRIAQLGDIHFGSEDKAAILATRDIINHCDVDGVAICGDITQNGAKAEFEAAASWVSGLQPPCIIVPGNHDTPMFGLAQRILRPWSRFNKVFKPYSRPLLFDEIGLAPLNTARGWQVRGNWAEGRVGLSEMRTALAHVVSKPVSILVCHHPLFDHQDAALKTATSRGEEAEEVLTAMGVSLVLTGHVHAPSVVRRSINDRNYVAIGTGTLSCRTRTTKASFNLIDVSPTMLRVVAVAPQYTPSGHQSDRMNGQTLYDGPLFQSE